MALRSVWVGGVCNFMPVQNKHFRLPLSEGRKKKDSFACVRTRSSPITVRRFTSVVVSSKQILGSTRSLQQLATESWVHFHSN